MGDKVQLDMSLCVVVFVAEFIRLQTNASCIPLLVTALSTAIAIAQTTSTALFVSSLFAVNDKGTVPDLLGDIGEECESVLNPHKAIENLFGQVGTELFQATGAFGVQRDLVAGIMVSEDKPIITKGRGSGWTEKQLEMDINMRLRGKGSVRGAIEPWTTKGTKITRVGCV